MLLLRRAFGTFRHRDLRIERRSTPSAVPSSWDPPPPFGTLRTEYMLEIDYRGPDAGWDRPLIRPFADFALSPLAKVFHYAPELFEGMKAYKGDKDGRVRLFRPQLNMRRMVASAERACLPTFDPAELLLCIAEHVALEQAWFPSAPDSCLYLRPFLFGTEAALGLGPSATAKLAMAMVPSVGGAMGPPGVPIRLLADPAFARAVPGGTGNVKMGANYAGTLAIRNTALAQGCQEVLWLDGAAVTEMGVMNVFFVIRDAGGGQVRVVTPSLDSGLILPGVTRQSVVDLAVERHELVVEERGVSMDEVESAAAEGRLLEMFGTGTACIVVPVKEILYQPPGRAAPRSVALPFAYLGSYAQIFRDQLLDIQYGREKREDWVYYPLDHSTIARSN